MHLFLVLLSKSGSSPLSVRCVTMYQKHTDFLTQFFYSYIYIKFTTLYELNQDTTLRCQKSKSVLKFKNKFKANLAHIS